MYLYGRIMKDFWMTAGNSCAGNVITVWMTFAAFTADLCRIHVELLPDFCMV